MKRFLSTKNNITFYTLWAIVIGMIALVINSFNSNDFYLLPTVILMLVIAIIVWILIDTRYVIKTNFLLYRSGPFRGRIDIKKIKKIQFHSGLFVPVSMKPSLDTNGLIITYNQFDDVFISPQNKTVFLEELKKINPNIEIND
jgi:hypothetical protein